MSEPSVSEMRAVSELSDDALAEAYPWPAEGTWVRAMMLTTLDGAVAGPDGVSRSVTSPSDGRVFAATRRYADAVLIGAQTLRAEEYTPLKANPVLVVVSGSLELPWHLPLWAESTHRPIVITRVDVPADRLADAQRHADVVQLSATSPAAIIAVLVERGLRRIVCEGGPRFLNELLAADLVDEADITVAPLFAGTANSPETPALGDPLRRRLVHVLRGDDDFLMMRYLRGPA